VSAEDCAELTTISDRQLAAGGQPAFNAGAGSFDAQQAGEVALSANTRTTQIANRISMDDRNAYRMLGGVRGPITDNINYDLYYSYARTKNANVQLGNI